MNKVSGKKSRWMIFFGILCCLVYFAGYMTRINYAAALVEIMSDLNISKQLASMAVTGSFITYGVGQLISGILGDHIPPRYVIAEGLIGTSLLNLVVPVMPNIYFMTVLWCFNGFFQAMLWPPLVRMMAENLDERHYNAACVFVSAAASTATIFVYMLAPFLILLQGWRLVFIFSGAVGLLVSIIWLLGTRSVASKNTRKNDKTAEDNGDGRMFKTAITSGLISIMIAIILQGILRDGIGTWMPTYFKEVYSLDNASSILTAVILPIFSIISVSAASALQRLVKNELASAALLYLTAFAAVLIMISFFSSSVLLSALLMAVITGCMHGINLMLISRLPLHYKKYGRVSTISGALNACTYIGSAISAYGFAYLSGRFGWRFTVILWAVTAFVGCVLCVINIRRWATFTSQ